jgi:hypothetical protein
VLSVSCVLQKFNLPPEFLGYLTDHRSGCTNGARVEVDLFIKLNLVRSESDTRICL